MTTETTAPKSAQEEPKSSVPPAFVETVKAFLKGDEKPKSPQSSDVLDSLKAAVAEQEALISQMNKIEQAHRDGQAKGQQFLGKIDALVSVLHRLETHAGAGSQP